MLGGRLRHSPPADAARLAAREIPPVERAQGPGRRAVIAGRRGPAGAARQEAGEECTDAVADRDFALERRPLGERLAPLARHSFDEDDDHDERDRGDDDLDEPDEVRPGRLHLPKRFGLVLR